MYIEHDDEHGFPLVSYWYNHFSSITLPTSRFSSMFVSYQDRTKG